MEVLFSLLDYCAKDTENNVIKMDFTEYYKMLRKVYKTMDIARNNAKGVGDYASNSSGNSNAILE